MKIMHFMRAFFVLINEQEVFSKDSSLFRPLPPPTLSTKVDIVVTQTIKSPRPPSCFWETKNWAVGRPGNEASLHMYEMMVLANHMGVVCSYCYVDTCQI